MGANGWVGSYSGSKRTLELMAETLRLEVAPFGVDVLSIVTGGVVSQGQTYFEDFALPKDSMYRKIEDTIASRARGGDGMSRMSLTEYAEQVAEAIVSRKTGRIWAGDHADSTQAATTGPAPQETMVGGPATLVGWSNYLRTRLWPWVRASTSCREARQPQSRSPEK